MRARWGAAAVVALVVVAGAYAADVKLDGVKCIVNPKHEVKADVCVEYNGAKVYFCCGDCCKAYSESPEKFAAKANHQLVGTGQAKAVKCALTGRPLNPEHAVKIAGVDVCFCCPMCKGKVAKAEGDDQINLVFGKTAFEKGFKIEKAEKK